MPAEPASEESFLRQILDDSVRERWGDEVLSIRTTRMLSLKPLECARAVFKRLHSRPHEVMVQNLLRLLARLALHDPNWKTLVEKSLGKRGRCPKGLVDLLGAELTREAGQDTQKLAKGVERIMGDLPRQKLLDWPEGALDSAVPMPTLQRRILKRYAKLPLSTELSSIRGMESLASRLTVLTPPPPRVELGLTGVDHLFVNGIAALIAWCIKGKVEVGVSGADADMEDYLTRIGFFRALQGQETVYQQDRADGFAVTITPIGSHLDSERVSNHIVEILDSWALISKAEVNALYTLFAELIENVVRHGGESVGGFAGAQTYPKRRKLNIVIADTGIGIRESFLRGWNEDAKRRIRAGEAPLELACRPLVTSKPHKGSGIGHTGYGLYVVAELVRRNGGTLRILSGSQIYTTWRMHWNRNWSLAKVDGDWQGTWISIIIDLDQPLPILDVYGSLPPNEIVDDEEFF